MTSAWEKAFSEQLAESVPWASLKKRRARRQDLSSAVLDALGSLVVVLDRAGHIVAFNGICEQTTGYSFKEVRGRPFWDLLLAPSEIEAAKKAFGHLRAGDFPNESEGYWVGKDGRRVLISWSKTAIVDAHGDVACVVGVGIRRRQLAEERLAERQFWLDTVTDALPDYVFFKDGRGRWLIANESALRLFELDNVDYRGKTEPELAAHTEFYRDALLYCVQSDEAAWQAGRTIHSEEYIPQRDGTVCTVDAIKVPLFNSDGSRKGLVVIGRDITQRKRTEQALQDSESKLRALINNAPYGIYRTNVEGKFLEANPALVSMLGYDSEGEVQRVNLATDVYVNANDRAGFISMATSEHAPPSYETRWRRKDGAEIMVRLRGRAARKADGSIAYFEGFAEDVTQHRDLEQQLRQAQKMEAIGQLAGGIAHDFNNLLMLILGNAGQLVSGLTKEHSLRSQAEEVVRAGEQAGLLIRQLLAFSRKQVLTPEIVDANAVVGRLNDVLLRLLGEDIRTVIAPAPEPVLVKADPVQLQQVLMNLAVNARDAMPDGGTLTIAIDTVAPRQCISSQAHVCRYIAGGCVALRVSDTGCGMSPEVQSHLFEPFFTTKGLNKGTGLGLATVYGIVKQTGGRISVESTVGKGTTFWVCLPRSQELATATLAPRESSALLRRGWETILLVEDEDGIRTMTRTFLEQHGYLVFDAKTGEEALRLAHSYDGAIHLLISDVVMPGMRGTELADRLVEQRSELKVLLITGYSGDQVVPDNRVLLEKPFAMEVLGQKLADMLRSPAAEDAA